MKLFNCHTHTIYSHDGSSSITDLCNFAQSNRLFGFAVTDHCDCEYASDIKMRDNLNIAFNETEKIKKQFSGNLIISNGIEIGEAIINKSFADSIISSNNYDVVLGSVHAVRIESFDMPFSVIDFSSFDDIFIEKYINQYFTDLYETTKTTDFDILSHLTVVLRYIVHKFNRKVDIQKQLPIIEKILLQVIKRNKCLEVNTSGFSMGYLMPDTDIIKLYKSLGGEKISIGSDAHIAEHLTDGLFDAAAILKSIGFDKLIYYIQRQEIEYPI